MAYIGVLLLIIVVATYGYWIWLMTHGTAVVGEVSNGVQKFHVKVKGVYSPHLINAKVGIPLQIIFTREEDVSCSQFVVFSDFKIRRELPQGKNVIIEFTPNKKGTFSFTCDMGMYQGTLIVS